MYLNIINIKVTAGCGSKDHKKKKKRIICRRLSLKLIVEVRNADYVIEREKILQDDGCFQCETRARTQRVVNYIS